MKRDPDDQPLGSETLVDLIERRGTITLYPATDMNHHAIAKKLGMGTQRVTGILKGLKKLGANRGRTN
jgi:hypothetical protein